MPATVQAIAVRLGRPAPQGSDGTVVFDVTHDSRAVVPGSLFVAIRGANHDGHDHIATAEASGAVAVLVDRPVPAGVPALVVDDTRIAMPIAARVVHGDPDEALSIVGVTGTNGKTTVTHMCEAAWVAAGRRCGIVGTLGARYDGTPIPLARTTPESSDLQRLLGTMASAGVESVAMEVSSHALELHRADAIRFTAVGFTNLTQDHLDFHGDMESYFATKARLFTPERSARGVVNVGDPAGARLAATAPIDIVTVGIEVAADITGTAVWSTPTGTDFVLGTAAGSLPVSLPLVGSFNVANALVAAGLLIEDGLAVDAIAAGLGSVAPVAGRMEVIGHDGPFAVIVDYAHTPDAIATVLAAARDAASGRVIALVGAGGDRDRTKRGPMGVAAASVADLTIVTTDNPRSEPPEVIAAAVAQGAASVPGADVRTVLDRREAIAEAIRIAEPGDMVMVLGKGHEQGQEVAGTTLPFDDRIEARAVLEAEGWHTT